MLILSRKHQQRIFIGPDVVVTVVLIRDGKVRLGVDAPKDTLILREELLPRLSPVTPDDREIPNG